MEINNKTKYFMNYMFSNLCGAYMDDRITIIRHILYVYY